MVNVDHCKHFPSNIFILLIISHVYLCNVYCSVNLIMYFFIKTQKGALGQRVGLLLFAADTADGHRQNELITSF